MQITDTHIRRKGDLLHHMIHTGRELRRCVAELEALHPRPAFVIATGDLVERGKKKEYRRLRKILSDLTIPLYVVAGNHDDRAGLRATFAADGYLPRSGRLCYVVESRPVRLIVLDTTRGRKRGGEVDAEQRGWLDARLREAPTTPTLIAMHHPPFDVGVAAIDSPALDGRDEFASMLAAHSHVVRVIAGHVHQSHVVQFGGTVAATAPSTAHQLVIERATAGGYGLRLEPPGYVLHRWAADTLEAHVVRTGEQRSQPVWC